MSVVSKLEPLVEEIDVALHPEELFACFKDEENSFLLDCGQDGGLTHLPDRQLSIPGGLGWGCCDCWGPYSFIGYDPFLLFKSKGDSIEIIYPGRNRTKLKGNPFDILKELLKRYKLKRPSNDLPPFLGGAVGYFSYDLCHHLEELPRKACDDLNLPDSLLGLYDTVIALDWQRGKAWISSTGFPEEENSRVRQRQRARLNALKKKLHLFSRRYLHLKKPFPTMTSRQKNRLSSNFSKAEYIDAVNKAKEYIVKGDIFQVNLSQRFLYPDKIDPYDLFRRLRTINPAPFAGLLNFSEVKVVSSSLERFLRIWADKVQTRPIKGTRPRGKDHRGDLHLAEQLLNSQKDKAELVMIVDVERNDLGRACRFGTVSVPELITLERHPTVLHLVATVEGRLRQGKGPIDCLKAGFPGGSITGAPKIRAMEIIEELEPTKRSVYTGSIGFLDFTGEADLNIVIRTFLVTPKGIYFQVGGGIVADSRPEAEYEETLHKARALIEALRDIECKTERITPALTAR